MNTTCQHNVCTKETGSACHCTLKKYETLLFKLNQLAIQDADDIDSNDFDIYGETQDGHDAVQTVKITDIAQEAYDAIRSLNSA